MSRTHIHFLHILVKFVQWIQITIVIVLYNIFMREVRNGLANEARHCPPPLPWNTRMFSLVPNGLQISVEQNEDSKYTYNWRPTRETRRLTGWVQWVNLYPNSKLGHKAKISKRFLKMEIVVSLTLFLILCVWIYMYNQIEYFPW